MYTPLYEAKTNAYNDGVSPYKCYFSELPVSNINKNTVYVTSKQAYDGTLIHNMAATIVPEYSRIAESTYT